jgi:hypothetical protein
VCGGLVHIGAGGVHHVVDDSVDRVVTVRRELAVLGLPRGELEVLEHVERADEHPGRHEVGAQHTDFA